MKISWMSGFDVDKKKDFKQSFYAAREVRERLVTLLRNKVESARTELRIKDSYESPNWAYKQADLCGYERAMLEVISLIES